MANELDKFCKKLRKLTDNNEHLEATIEIAKRFLFLAELEELERMLATMNANGYMSVEDSRRATEMQTIMICKIGTCAGYNVYSKITKSL